MGMESGNGLSVADVAALQNRDNDGMFGGAGGTWIWVFFLFFLLAWGGNGLGFGNNAAGLQGALTRADLCQEFNFNGLENSIRGVQNGLCDGFYAMNTTMLQGMNNVQSQLCNGFNGVNTNIAENRYAAQQCCCETNRNIDAVRAENYRNTCDIVNTIKADGEATRALMTANTIQDLRDKLSDRDRDLQTANFQLFQQAQNSTLISTLRPFPQPAYITCSPYTSANGYGACGCNSGC